MSLAVHPVARTSTRPYRYDLFCLAFDSLERIPGLGESVIAGNEKPVRIAFGPVPRTLRDIEYADPTVQANASEYLFTYPSVLRLYIERDTGIVVERLEFCDPVRLWTLVLGVGASIAGFWCGFAPLHASAGRQRRHMHRSLRPVRLRQIDRGDIAVIDGVRLPRGRSLPGAGARRQVRCGNLAAWDLEMRDPTADKRIVEYCYAIPGEQFMRNGETKWLLRRAMDGILPKALLKERSRGRQGADWPEAGQKDRDAMFEEVALQATNSTTARLLDLDRINAILRNWKSEGIRGSAHA